MNNQQGFQTPPQSPREQKCPDAPLRNNNQESAREEHEKNCVCHTGKFCEECQNDFMIDMFDTNEFNNRSLMH